MKRSLFVLVIRSATVSETLQLNKKWEGTVIKSKEADVGE